MELVLDNCSIVLSFLIIHKIGINSKFPSTFFKMEFGFRLLSLLALVSVSCCSRGMTFNDL